MGQKTNPTALRLEKTNKHYAGCWYADYHYAPQLQNHFMVCDYINKIFQKIKRCEPFIYFKAHQQGNQIFYIFPKKRRRFSRSYRATSNSRASKKASRKAVSGIQLTTHLSSIIYGLSQWKSSLLEEATNLSSLKGYLSMKNSNGAPLAGFRQNISDRVSTSTNPETTRYDQVKNNYLHLETAYPREKEITQYSPIHKQNNWDNLKTISIDPPVLSKPLLLWILCLRHSLSTPPWAKLANGVSKGQIALNSKQTPITGRGAKNSHRKSMEKALYNQSRVPQLAAATRNYTLVPIGVSSVTQNAEFIAQKISQALSRRVPFNRFRRQILWEAKRAKHLKGLRVSISGRVESKSKKAQKARTRTFQWGQTELHVFSSLVQFVPKDLQTPFGKIGIKVWVCYGAG